MPNDCIMDSYQTNSAVNPTTAADTMEGLLDKVDGFKSVALFRNHFSVEKTRLKLTAR